MEPFVRRSHLMVSALDEAQLRTSWQQNADAVVLDLGDSIAAADKPRAREGMQEAVAIASRGGAEVFAGIHQALAHADIAASVWPGLSGIVYTGAENGADVEGVDAILSAFENERGFGNRALQMIVMLDSGRGVWNIREIINASPRVCSVGLDESGLCRDLGIVPNAEFDPFVYAKGRVIIEGRAAKKQPVGTSHPYGLLPQFDDAEAIHAALLRGRNTGFAGVMCLHPAWVEPCNRAYTPTEERLGFYRETRRLFADGIAKGTAAIPYPGTTMMIDVPVDERARITLELYDRCAARDAAKAAAVARAKAAGY